MGERNVFTLEEMRASFMKGYDLANVGVGEEHLIHEWMLFIQKINNKSEDNTIIEQLTDDRMIKWDL